jgi:hypothetical protein
MIHITAPRLRKALCMFAVLCLAALTTRAQSEPSLKYASQIDPSMLHTLVNKIASDEFEGRNTGTPGSTMAAEYIVTYFKYHKVKAGNGKSFMQDIKMSLVSTGNRLCRISRKNIDTEFKYSQHYAYVNYPEMNSMLKTSRIVVLSNKVCESQCPNLKELKLEGKGILLLDSDKKYAKIDCLEAEKPEFIAQIEAVPAKPAPSGTYPHFHSAQIAQSTPRILMDEHIVNKLLEPEKTGLAALSKQMQDNPCTTLTLDGRFVFGGNNNIRPLPAMNILAFIEGGDLKHEYVVLCAHYDHVGRNKDEIFNGADDNASGTAAVMEIARLLTLAKREGHTLRRSVAVILFTGEEHGLKGSEYYVNYPVYPLDKTVACFNLDMIGRIANEQQATGNKYVYLDYHQNDAGKHDSCIKLVNSNSTKLKIIDNVFPQQQGGFARSDQYSFHCKNVPAILLTSGLHDDYHTPKDIAKRIDYIGMTERTRLAFLSVWSYANDFQISH